MKRQLLFIFIITCCALPMQLHAAQVNIATAVKQPVSWSELWMIGLAENGTRANIQRALDSGIWIDAQDDEGQTVLIAAVRRNKLEIVQLLANRHANLNLQDNAGYTALREAVCKTYHDMVKVLTTAGADPNIQNEYGWPALMEAAWKGSGDNIITLLNAGANPHRVNYNAQTIRDYLSKRGAGEDSIKSTIETVAERTLNSLLTEKHPELLEDAEIKQALADYEQRFIQHKKNTAQKIEASIKTVHFLPVLANIVADYAVEHAPSVQSKKL